jgi:hypothetical protein
MMVERKDFFGGGSKLAVENIPADAVKEIEVIDDYNKIGFLKGLTDSEEMAMNIKLKENKKRFIFGDIVAGVSKEKHYLAQANLFYYAPKTNLSYIGNLNNTGYKAFTFKDYMTFQGGISKILNTKSLIKTSQSNFSDFFENPEYISNTSKFNALNWRQSLHKKIDFSMYGIFSDNLTQTKTIADNQYITNDIVILSEKRIQEQQNNKNFGMAKVAIEYHPNSKNNIEYNLFSKLSDLKFIDNTNTQSTLDNNYIKSLNTGKTLQIKQNFEWSNRAKRKHTFTFSASHEYNKNSPKTRWLTDKPILQDLIPLIITDDYQIIQTKENNTHKLNSILKYYWVINNLNHIYTSIGNQYVNQLYRTHESQLLTDNIIHSFSDDGFGNDLHFTINDLYAGIQYKFKKNKTIFKPGIYGHYYQWETLQSQSFSKNKFVLLPELIIKHNFKKTEKIIFKYYLKSSFTDASKYANQFYLNSFNTVFKGNNKLENELQHDISLSYRKYSMYKNITIFSKINYTNKIIGIKNQYQIHGINQYIVPEMIVNPENNLLFVFSIRKGVYDYYLKLKNSISIYDYNQNINSVKVNTKSFSQSYHITIGTTFDKYPNIDLGFLHKNRQYISGQTNTKYTSNEPFFKLSYDFLKGFILKTDYLRSIFKRDKKTTIFHKFANASLFYQKENSPFGFEIKATNLLDVNHKTQSSLNDYLISEKQSFIMPRLIIFKLNYKL